MKSFTTVFAICSLSMGSFSYADLEKDYTNQIIQIQRDPNFPEAEPLSYPVVVGTSGQMDAVMEIIFGESTFELWSVKNDNPGEPKLLDTTVVNGFYSPEIWIDSLDPSSPASSPRTRSDRPFSVRVEGVSEEYVIDASANLQMVWNGEDLPAGEFEFPENHETNYSAGTPVNTLLPSLLSGSLDFDANATDLGSVWSRETFSLWERGDNGTPMLSSRYVTIWPTASIEFESGKGLVDGATYRVFPEVEVSFNNLYAVDNWFVWVESEDGTLTSLGSGPVTTNIPVDKKVSISEKLTELITKSGTYTLYGAQQAPGLDIVPNQRELATFTFIGEIKVRANVVGSE